MKLRRINASAIALYLMLALLNAGALLLLDHLSQRQQVVQERQAVASRQTERFLEADRHLTNQVRAFIVTADPVYERAYWQEVQVTRRFEQAQAALEGLGLPREDIALIELAKSRSDALVQVESLEALKNLDAIVATPGVDLVLIRNKKKTTSMGHVGNAAHPDVQAAIADAIDRILKAGKAPGILTPDRQLAAHYLSLGAVFVAVGLDTQILMRQTTELAAHFKSALPAAAPAKGATY